MIRLPGLVDVHVHTRDPGQTHKEDWASTTAAALAGGITAVLAMPNTSPPVTDGGSLARARGAAAAKARCDYGQYLGATTSNVAVAAANAADAAGLKLYLDHTFGELRLDRMTDWRRHLEAWPHNRPLVAHAEGRSLGALLFLASVVDRPVHVCHVATRDEIELVRAAKEAGRAVTCEVTPHHLLLDDKDTPALGPGRSEVRPPLATPDDRAALWEHLEAVDCFATDHAPHLAAEKDGASPPPGFPGLETALPLLLTAVHEGALELDDVVRRMSDRPREMFRLPHQEETWVEVDEEARWQVGAPDHSRAGWTPFAGRPVWGRVERVVLRGNDAYRDGRVLAEPGSGIEITNKESQ